MVRPTCFGRLVFGLVLASCGLVTYRCERLGGNLGIDLFSDTGDLSGAHRSPPTCSSDARRLTVPCSPFVAARSRRISHSLTQLVHETRHFCERVAWRGEWWRRSTSICPLLKLIVVCKWTNLKCWSNTPFTTRAIKLSTLPLSCINELYGSLKFSGIIENNKRAKSPINFNIAHPGLQQYSDVHHVYSVFLLLLNYCLIFFKFNLL